MLNVQAFDQGLLGSNTFLVWDDASLEGLIVDCGNRPEAVKTFASCKGVKVKYIVLTHGHYDHAEYAENYKSAFAGAMLVCHAAEKPVLTDAEANVSELFGAGNIYPLPDIELEEDDILALGESELVCIHTPGHTPGSICLYCEREKVMFTGDTLFRRTIGLVSCPGGNVLAEKHSIFHVLYQLPDDTRVYPGHGWPTTIWEERCYNPYARKLI